MAKRRRLESSGINRDEKRDWSSLPSLIVEQIGDLLLDEDVLSYLPLRGVCMHGRQSTEDPAITQRRFCPRNWIFLWDSDESDNQVLTSKPRHCFLNTLNGKRLVAHIPELRNNTVHACLDGLLFITGRYGDRVTSRLLNPFTGSAVEYPDILELYSIRCVEPEMRMRQQALSFADSTSSAILVIGLEFMAYAKPGYKEWKVISQGMNHYHWHLFFQGSPYSFSCRGDLVRFDLEEGQTGQVELRTETLMTGPPRGVPPRGVQTCYYLVECDGKMLAVLWSRCTQFYGFFRIFAVVNQGRKGGNGDKVSLVPVRDIGQHAILIHPWHRCVSVSITTDATSCFHPNSIYFYQERGSAPKMYTMDEGSSDYELADEQFSESRSFSPFPVSGSKQRDHTINFWWSCG